MRSSNGKYACVLCGTPLDLPIGAQPVVVIVASGGKPNMRVIEYKGREVHRCELVRSR